MLSRVTLGADIAVSSAVIDAAKRRFPGAAICFVGPAKNAELFAADERVYSARRTVQPVGTAAASPGRVGTASQVRGGSRHACHRPDSRLSQLGLIPVCDEDRYLFFESRTYGAESNSTLPVLTARWLQEAFGVGDARPFLAPESPAYTADITVSLGVGGNSQKRIAGPFESRAVAALLATGKRVMIDRGIGGEETERVDRVAKSWAIPHSSCCTMARSLRLPATSCRAGSTSVTIPRGNMLRPLQRSHWLPFLQASRPRRTYERWKPSGRGPIWTIKVSAEDRHSAESRAFSAISEAVEAMPSHPGHEAAAPARRVSP